MRDQDNVVSLNNPSKNQIEDLLTDIAREGAQKMLAAALDLEVSDFLAKHAQCRTESGHARFVRNGHLPERKIQTGIGDIEIKQARVRDRVSNKSDVVFRSSIIPPYLRRSKSIDKLLPVLYLKGISTGDFKTALAPIVGDNAKNLSPNVISNLKASWQNEYQEWNQRDLSLRHYVYWWVDGIYLQARMEDAKDCVLVIIGVNEHGKKELIAIEDGYRESKESWQSLLRDLKKRGLNKGPEVVTGDGALGFWAAINEEFPKTRHQRCWCHKTCNVLDKLPKSQQSKAKDDLHEIWMAETKEDANKAFDAFIKKYQLKYSKAVECLIKDREELLTFYDFPAEHWKPLRTTNPIESTFATVRHRTKRVKGCFSRKTILTMVFKLCQSAQETWNRMHGFKKLADVIAGIKFADGLPVTEKKSDQTVAA